MDLFDKKLLTPLCSWIRCISSITNIEDNAMINPTHPNPIFIPEKLGIKDFSDLIHIKGSKKAIEIITELTKNYK